MRIRTLVSSCSALLLLAAPAAVAQTSRLAAVSVTAGVATGQSESGVALGGTALCRLNNTVFVEGQGTYFDRGTATDAFTIGGSVLINLRPAPPLMPYAAVGGGLYHVTFELANPHFLGRAGNQFAPGSTVCATPGRGVGSGPSAGWGPGGGTCPANAAGYWGVGMMPTFYARRLGELEFPSDGEWRDRSFNDPALSVGGGVRWDVSDHLMLRPDFRAFVVFANGETYTMGVFVVNLGYRF